MTEGIYRITGQDAETHSAATVSGMQAAKEIREQTIAAIVSGEIRVMDIIQFSKGQTVDAKYISKIRLRDILKARPGWTDATAEEALIRNGFQKTDSLITIRRHPRMVKTFAEVFDTSPERWRARPAPITGWPWNGKLTELIRQAGGVIPEELGGAPTPSPFVPHHDVAAQPTPSQPTVVNDDTVPIDDIEDLLGSIDV